MHQESSTKLRGMIIGSLLARAFGFALGGLPGRALGLRGFPNPRFGAASCRLGSAGSPSRHLPTISRCRSPVAGTSSRDRSLRTKTVNGWNRDDHISAEGLRVRTLPVIPLPFFTSCSIVLYKSGSPGPTVTFVGLE